MKDYYHKPCPKCGSPMYHSSELCVKCRSASSAKVSRHPKDACPRCGRPKLVSSSVCFACHLGKDFDPAPYQGRTKTDCPSPDWNLATRDFLVQFAGIFMSEGCLHCRLSRDKTLSISMAIKLRLDDADCLKLIQSVLGGSFKTYIRPGNHSPEAIWVCTKRDDVRAILLAIQPLIVIPMKKTREFDVALEYFAWRDSVGFHHVDRAKIAEFFQRLADLKKLPDRL